MKHKLCLYEELFAIRKEIVKLKRKENEVRMRLLNSLVDFHVGLTERQREVVNILAKEPSLLNKQIADKLHVTERTIKFHMHNIFRLYGASDRQEFLYVIGVYAKKESV